MDLPQCLQGQRSKEELRVRKITAYLLLLATMFLYFVNHLIAVGGVFIGFLRHRRRMWSMALDFPLVAEAMITGLCLFSFIFIYMLYDTDRHKSSGRRSPSGGFSVVGQFLRFTDWLEVTWRGGFVPKLIGMAMIAKLVCDNLVVSMTTLDGAAVMKSNDHHIACRYESDYLHFLDRSLPTPLPYDSANFTNDSVWDHDISLEQACNDKVMNKSIKAVDKAWCRTYLAGVIARKYDIICILPAILQSIIIGHEIAEYPPYGQVWKDFIGCAHGNGCELTYTFALDFILTRTGATREITVRNRGSKRHANKYFLNPDESKISNNDYREYWMTHSTQWINTHAIKEQETVAYILSNGLNASNESVVEYKELDHKLDEAREKLTAARKKWDIAKKKQKDAERLAQKKLEKAQATENLTEANTSTQGNQRADGNQSAETKQRRGSSVSAFKTNVKQLEKSKTEILNHMKELMGGKVPPNWEGNLDEDQLRYDATGEIVLMKLWETIVDVMTAPSAPHSNISDYQFDKCEYQCGQILAPSMKLTDLIDELPSILAGGTIINEFSRSVAPWLLNKVSITPVFITKDSGPEELLSVYKHLKRDHDHPRDPAVAVQIVVLAAVAVFSLPGCVDIIACNFHTSLNWLVGIGAKCLLVATSLVIMQLMSIFKYVPFARQAWEEGEGEFLVTNDEHEMEPKTVKLVEWVQMSSDQQFEMLMYKARGISETEVDKAIKALQAVNASIPTPVEMEPCFGEDPDKHTKAQGLSSLVQLNTYSSLLSSMIKANKGANPSAPCMKRSLSQSELKDKLSKIKVDLGDPEEDDDKGTKADKEAKAKAAEHLLPLVITFVANQTVLADRYVVGKYMNDIDKEGDAYKNEGNICKKRAFAEELDLCGDQRMFGFVISRSATPGKVLVLVQQQQGDRADEEFWVADVAVATLIDGAPKWKEVADKAKELKMEKLKKAGKPMEKLDAKMPDYLEGKTEGQAGKQNEAAESGWKQYVGLPDLVFLEASGIFFFRYLLPLFFFLVPVWEKIQRTKRDLLEGGQQKHGTDYTLRSDYYNEEHFGDTLLGTITSEELPSFLTVFVLIPGHLLLEVLIRLYYLNTGKGGTICPDPSYRTVTMKDGDA